MASSPASRDFEQLGLFYLGRRYDLGTGRTLDEPVLYDSRDLVTHAVCVGMTGSGKTGLCLDLIEEAAIDGVPVLAIDPKGDIGNLLLTFPGLSPAEFRPWMDQDEARRAGVDADTFAGRQAEAWAKGLSEWGQGGDRIERLRRSAEFTIFTPGSQAGKPVSIVSSFAAPPDGAEDAELLAERASGTATSALVLSGVDAAPRSREHSLLTAILTASWQRGVDLDLASMIREIQEPPFDRVGVMDLESFYPAKERFELAMQLNNVLAAPGFQTWLEGEPLDPATLLYTAAGRPRVSIFSIAHLADGERMFFVSLLLNQVVSWMRRQTGTTSLRALIYMDEIAGYFPPVANPPSKPPLLTLLKQARAFGVGVVLATQNPVDLDYKGLANTGTWFLGRLQTERDKARVLDGLEGAAQGGMDRGEVDRTLSALPKRVFLMHNVHESEPVVFETRWTLSYLRGPLSRDQIKRLADGTDRAAAPAQAGTAVPAAAAAAGASAERPLVPPGIQEFFLPRAGGAGGPAVYQPSLLGVARVSFSDRVLSVDATKEVLYAAPITADAIQVDWEQAERLEARASDLERQPDPSAAFAPLPAVALQAKKYSSWEKSFARWVAQRETVELLRHPTLGITSRPDETERDFRIRMQLAARSARDEALEEVRKKYAAKQAALAERLRRAESAVDREQQQVSDQKVQTAVSIGATLLGALLGRRAVSASTLGRATTSARGMSRTMKEASDVKRASETVDAVRADIERLESQIAADTALVAGRFEQDAEFSRVAVRPKRGQVEVQFVALLWRETGAQASRTEPRSAASDR